MPVGAPPSILVVPICPSELCQENQSAKIPVGAPPRKSERRFFRRSLRFPFQSSESFFGAISVISELRRRFRSPIRDFDAPPVISAPHPRFWRAGERFRGLKS